MPLSIEAVIEEHDQDSKQAAHGRPGGNAEGFRLPRPRLLAVPPNHQREEYQAGKNRTGSDGQPEQKRAYFMNTPDAQSFLHFGENPDGLDTRQADTMYRQEVDGREAVRVIYRARTEARPFYPRRGQAPSPVPRAVRRTWGYTT